MKYRDLVYKVYQQRLRLINLYGMIALFGIFMIVIRKTLKFSGGYTFLLWNFFLAMLPLVVSSFLVEFEKMKTRNSYMVVLGLFWLLLFPNALYMLSDYKYVWNDESDNINMNILSLSWFIIPALLAAVVSLNDISNILIARMDEKMARRIIPLIYLITGFGVYIGCYLRFNFWDIFYKPGIVIGEIAGIFIHPVSNFYAWIVSMAYGFILYLVVHVIRLVGKEPNFPEK